MSLIQEALRRKQEEEGRDPGTPRPVERPSAPDTDAPETPPSERDRKYIVPTLVFTISMMSAR